jgi:hypothetical protein
MSRLEQVVTKRAYIEWYSSNPQGKGRLLLTGWFALG